MAKGTPACDIALISIRYTNVSDLSSLLYKKICLIAFVYIALDPYSNEHLFLPMGDRFRRTPLPSDFHDFCIIALQGILLWKGQY